MGLLSFNGTLGNLRLSKHPTVRRKGRWKCRLTWYFGVWPCYDCWVLTENVLLGMERAGGKGTAEVFNTVRNRLELKAIQMLAQNISGDIVHI